MSVFAVLPPCEEAALVAEADTIAVDPHAPQRCAADRTEFEGTCDGWDAVLFHADEHHGGHLCTVLGDSCDRFCPGRNRRRRGRRAS